MVKSKVLKRYEGHGIVEVLSNKRTRKYPKPLHIFEFLEGKEAWPERLKTSKKKFKDLKQAGCNIPKNITYDKEGKFYEYDDLGRHEDVIPTVDDRAIPKMLCAEDEKKDNTLSIRIGKQLAMVHNSDYKHSHHPVFSSMHIVKNGKKYEPVVADVGNLKKIRFEKERRIYKELSTCLDKVPVQCITAFLGEYLKHTKYKTFKQRLKKEAEWNPRLSIPLKALGF